MTAYIVDVETSSPDTQEIIELAICSADFGGSGVIEFSDIRSERFDAICFDASFIAIHGILPDDVIGHRCFSEASDLHASYSDAEFVIGHGVDFDADAIGFGEIVRRIDTLAIAKYLWPGFHNHKLGSVFLYTCGVTRSNVERLRGAHGAACDVGITCEVLKKILAVNPCRSFGELHELSELSRTPVVMPFGDHKGKPFADVPYSYLGWCLRQDWLDSYLRKALENFLGRV